MSVDAERKQVTHVLDLVEGLEKVAETMDPDDQRRHDLLSLAHKELSTVPAIRPVIAGEVLNLSRPTVMQWLEHGILRRAERGHLDVALHRTMLETHRLHHVWHILRDLREAGKTRGLAEAVWHRLEDQELLDHSDLQESIEQMRRAEGVDVDPEELRARILSQSHLD